MDSLKLDLSGSSHGPPSTRRREGIRLNLTVMNPDIGLQDSFDERISIP